MGLRIRKINMKDTLDGLRVLQNVTKENYDVSPLSIKANDKWYDAFLRLVKEEAEEHKCIAYWIIYNNKKIGFSEIRFDKSDIYGNIGIILEEEYQNKGLGYEAMKLLVEEAKNKYNLESITIVTNPDNKGMRKLCEKLGAELTDIDEKCKYRIK